MALGFAGRAAGIAACLLLAACSAAAPASSMPAGERDAAAETGAGDRPRCTSGVLASPDLAPGPEMNPGRACVDCHARSNAESGEEDAPPFAIAGTLYPSAHEPDQCVASSAEGAVVEVTDGAGVTWMATANTVGNFSIEAPTFVYPFRARVTFKGAVREMLAEQATGDCNGCHTQDGAMTAPGRIVLP